MVEIHCRLGSICEERQYCFHLETFLGGKAKLSRSGNIQWGKHWWGTLFQLALWAALGAHAHRERSGLPGEGGGGLLYFAAVVLCFCRILFLQPCPGREEVGSQITKQDFNLQGKSCLCLRLSLKRQGKVDSWTFPTESWVKVGRGAVFSRVSNWNARCWKILWKENMNKIDPA